MWPIPGELPMPLVDAHDSSVDLDEAVRWVAAIVGADDDRARRLSALE